mmetsp:Transcript_124739/g.266182  ORF Transcript_124739/g.266182 Transcript_124739/m.266182 type:complete len:216 (+) Transcript_124739:1148-1795(+)
MALSAFCWCRRSTFCFRDSPKERTESSTDSASFCSWALVLSSLAPRISTWVLSDRCCAATASTMVQSSFLRDRIESPADCNCVVSASSLSLSALLEQIALSLLVHLSMPAFNSCWLTVCPMAAVRAESCVSNWSRRVASALLAMFLLLCLLNCSRRSSALSTQEVLILSATVLSRCVFIVAEKSMACLLNISRALCSKTLITCSRSLSGAGSAGL